MRYIIIILLLFLSYNSYAQDPSFSQVDMNTMYMNPALCGSGGNTKFLSTRREQWKGFNGSGSSFSVGGNSPFTTTLIEGSTGIIGDKGRNGGIKAFNFGISFMGEDNLINNDLEGGVFIERQDLAGYMSLLVKLDDIGRQKKGWRWLQNKYMQFGFSYGSTRYGLNTDNLIFSDMIDAFGLQNPTTTASLPFITGKEQFHRFSGGVVLSMLGNTSNTKNNSTLIGYALQSMNEGFSSSSIASKKHTFHVEHKGSIPDWNLKIIPRWKVIYKSELYKTNDWSSRKREIGGSFDVGRNSPLEIGSFFRFNGQVDGELKWNDFHFQTYIPYIRLNLFGRSHGYQISYIFYEYESTNSQEWLYIGETGNTHEISLAIFLWGGKGPKECIEYGKMKNNALYNDLRENGVLSKSSRKGNFGNKRWHKKRNR